VPWDYSLRTDLQTAFAELEEGATVAWKPEGCEWSEISVDAFTKAWTQLGYDAFEDHEWDVDHVDTAIQTALFGELVFG
tara:strand:+ start:1208 stop:1444 length:237 start_codon:yes stop_codon:yes gene_type:complete